MDTRSLHIIWCNVINKIYPTVILHWELEIRCSCTHFTCSWVWTNYIVKHQIRLILMLRIYTAPYMRDWQLSLSGVQECSELRRIINKYTIYFWFHIWWMKFNRFDGHAWPFLGDMNLLEVKSSDWTLCMKKSKF